MTATTKTQSGPKTLSARYTQESGALFMSGNQALVRLPLQQRLRDRRAGLNTAGFISGYRGSPLGRFDMELWQAGKLLSDLDIHFQPGVNEDLAATAVWGTQHVPLHPERRFDGVFGIWYGKGPGVDRSGDAFKHANAAGVSPLGGVLVLAGDDHAAKSSTQAHQSDQALIAAGIPVLYPSNVQEILDFGLLGLAMSRRAGCWVSMKLVTDVVEGSGPVNVGLDQPAFVDATAPDDADLHIRHFEPAPAQEARLHQKRLPAAVAFGRANGVNRIFGADQGATLGIVSAGKSWTDLTLALDLLKREGVDVPQDRLRLLKVGMVWPLDPEIVTEFARGLETILVVEEKRPLLEEQIKTILYDVAGPRPRVAGKFHEGGGWASTPGAPLLSAVGELSPTAIADAIAAWLGVSRPDPATAGQSLTNAPAIDRAPTFCSGCPHSTSTRVPDGSVALAGIGCHSIAVLLDPVRTGPISHMGAEGVMWVGQSPFTERRHVFANIGDGTYFHSGFLAIRQSIAAKVNITYKLLLNGFVSMTGGQPIEGELTPAQLSQELLAEGVARIVVVADDPGKYAGQTLPQGVEVFHRERLDSVQKELREVDGVTVLIYDQMCATERRRQRKRGRLPDPDIRTFINPRVCEGCGDCGEKSNCLSVEPLETEYGRKRRINQASCNKDLSCVQGFCPSFVTVKGGKLRVAPGGRRPLPADLSLPEPIPAALDRPMGLVVTGIGGTGVITVGAILTMAAHLDGLLATSLDLTGLAQKYGAVMSHIRLGRPGQTLASYRLSEGEADVVLACDLIVTAGKEAISRMSADRTKAVLNTDLSPTRDFARNPDWNPRSEDLQARVGDAVSDLVAMPAGRIATELMGDPLMVNLFVLGIAWQKGWIPVSRASIEAAIGLNGVGVDANIAAFAWGRVAAHDPALLGSSFARESGALATTVTGNDLEGLIAARSADLTDYQNSAYAQRFKAMVDRVRQVETRIGAGEALTRRVAANYYKLLAYKDEYEVARLYSSPVFKEELKRTFDGDVRLSFHLGAGPFARRDPESGEVRKSEVGPWILPVFRGLASLRRLRGTWLDPFRRTEERRMALAALAEYEADIDRLLAEVDGERLPLALEIAGLPETIRGYGHVRAASLTVTGRRRDQLWAQWGGDVLAREVA